MDVELGDEAHPGLRVASTQHRYLETARAGGPITRCEPYRAPPAVGDWAGVALTEVHVIMAPAVDLD